MIALTPFEVALIAAILGPVSHFLLFIRLDLDSSSHRLLVLANLFIICTPITLYLRGWALSDALLISAVVEFWYTSSLLASIGIYRAFLHPLRAYPGPFLARITFIWRVKQFQDSGYQAYKVIDHCHQKYGNVVRTGPRQLSINEPAAYQAVYGANSECHRLKLLELVRKNLQSLADPIEHGARRKVWDYGLNARACQSYLPRIHETTQRLCARLAASDGRPVVINDLCHMYTFDIMGDLGFGRSYGQLETGRMHPAIIKVKNFLKAGVIAIQMLWVVNFLQMIPGLEDPMRDLKEWAKQLLAERAQAQKSGKSYGEKRDLMSYIEESRRAVDERWPMTDHDLAEDAVTLQVAGSDTSYSVIVNSCHFLANHPDLQEKIRKEILETFTSTENGLEPTWSKLASAQDCPYLDAMINEVLRLFPPVPQGLLRETPNHTIEIAGHIVPPNTIVSVPIWQLQHDERCFSQPHEFIPERWLDRSHPASRAELLIDKRGFVPFSVGQMNCAGKYFAYMEIKVCIAHILQQFKVDFAKDEKQQAQQDNEQARRARDQRLAEDMKDILTQLASTVEVCFRPLVKNA